VSQGQHNAPQPEQKNDEKQHETMTEKQKLEQQLWNIANTLCGRMGADDFRDYILGFIFYRNHSATCF